jgi:uncharacterized protein
LKALLDVNVLIALFDVEHVSHARSVEWLKAWSPRKWCSSPITQNALIRILSQPSYPRATTTQDMIVRVSEAVAHKDHEFLADDVSFAEANRFSNTAALGPKMVTDVYLLALAVAHDAAFITFDQRISINSVIGAKPEHLVVL